MTKLFIHENATENVVYEMAAILSRGRRVTDMGKSYHDHTTIKHN